MIRRLLVSLPLILIVAAGLRLAYLANYQSHAAHNALGTIPFLFEPGNIAYAIANGHGFSAPFRTDTGPTAWMTPVYPMLLAAVFRVFGTYTFAAFLTAVGLNIAFSTAACVPVFFAGQRIAGKTTGAVAAWLWAVFPNAILLPVEALWDASLAALLAASLLWATLGMDQTRRGIAWAAYGLLWGLALLTTPTLGILLPFLIGWLEFRAGWKLPTIATGVAVLCCIPWTVRNYVVFHAFVPLRSVLGLQLWIGNNERTESLPVGRLHPISNQAERDHYVEVGEIPYMREKLQAALEFMGSHPGTDAGYVLDRFIATWAGGTSHPFRDLMRGSGRFRFILLFNLFAAITALVGIVVLYRGRNAYWFPTSAFPIVFPCLAYLTLAAPRYRHPIDPVLLLLAAIPLTSIRRSPASRRVAGT